MKEDQNITHVRGDDLDVPITVTLDQSRTLDGAETWKWQLRRDVTGHALIEKTSPTGIEIDSGTKQPTLKLAAGDFPTSTFPPSNVDQRFVHELQMTSNLKVETISRGTFTLKSDIVR